MKGKMISGALAAVVGLGMCLGLSAEDKSSVAGDYIEARTCDVWTGPCFSNSEINLTGNHAVVGWSVREGNWKGTKLDGLKIVAALKAEGTFHTNVEGDVQAAVYVDQKATKAQEAALISMAQALAPKHLGEIIRIERKPITFTRDGYNASLKVGKDELASVKTKELNAHCDKICGNEEQAYPAFSTSTRVECAKTVNNTYVGRALSGARWTDLDSRSAMVGTFAR